MYIERITDNLKVTKEGGAIDHPEQALLPTIDDQHPLLREDLGRKTGSLMTRG